MPERLEHIDAIARQKQRDVLTVTFHPRAQGDAADWSDECHGYDYAADPIRLEILSWLDSHGLGWQPCGPVADEGSVSNYDGQLYIDVPFDEDAADYRQLRDYLENPDGSTRWLTVRFWVLPLTVAMQNAHHDEPGYWERWAKDF